MENWYTALNADVRRIVKAYFKTIRIRSTEPKEDVQFLADYLLNRNRAKSDGDSTEDGNVMPSPVDSVIRRLHTADIPPELMPNIVVQGKIPAEDVPKLMDMLAAEIIKFLCNPDGFEEENNEPMPRGHKRTRSAEVARLVGRIIGDVDKVMGLLENKSRDDLPEGDTSDASGAPFSYLSSGDLGDHSAAQRLTAELERDSENNPFPKLEELEKSVRETSLDDPDKTTFAFVSATNKALRQTGNHYAHVVSVFLSIIAMTQKSLSKSEPSELMGSLIRSLEKTSEELSSSNKVVVAVANKALHSSDGEYGLPEMQELADEAKRASEVARACLGQVQHMMKGTIAFQDHFEAIKKEMSTFNDHLQHLEARSRIQEVKVERKEAEDARKYGRDVAEYQQAVLHLKGALDREGCWEALLSSLAERTLRVSEENWGESAIVVVKGLQETVSMISNAHAIEHTTLGFLYVRG